MGKEPRLSWASIGSQLRQREVYPVIVAYALVGWILLQIGEVTFGPLGLPDWVMTTLVIAVIVGFPIAVALAWRYDITATGIHRDTWSADADAGTDTRPSIAVLPFLDLSPQKDQAYFCEGVAEAILNSLTGINQLRVVARSSSFQFSSQAGDIHHIGRKLNASAILEGSVRKSNGTIRVTAQLVKVKDGCHLWSKTFDRELEDIFAIQDEIAASIAAALLETVSARSKHGLSTKATSDVNAYDFYLRGRQFLKRFRKVDIENARQLFWQAINLDPNFAPAWAGYADCHSSLMMYADPKPDYPQVADTASARAVELMPELAEAHASRGLAMLVGRHFDKSEGHFRKALELNPHLFEALYFYGRAKFHQGDLAGAAELFRQAAETDPTDYQSRCLRVQILRGLGQVDQARDEAEDAVDVLEKHLAWNPDDLRGLHLGAGSLLLLGQRARALQWLWRALEIAPDDPIVLYNVACNMATMGEIEESLDHLERAAESGTISADWMQNDEDLVALRDEPRYVELLEKLKERENLELEKRPSIPSDAVA